MLYVTELGIMVEIDDGVIMSWDIEECGEIDFDSVGILRECNEESAAFICKTLNIKDITKYEVEIDNDIITAYSKEFTAEQILEASKNHTFAIDKFLKF